MHNVRYARWLCNSSSIFNHNFLLLLNDRRPRPRRFASLYLYLRILDLQLVNTYMGNNTCSMYARVAQVEIKLPIKSSYLYIDIGIRSEFRGAEDKIYGGSTCVPHCTGTIGIFILR